MLLLVWLFYLDIIGAHDLVHGIGQFLNFRLQVSLLLHYGLFKQEIAFLFLFYGTRNGLSLFLDLFRFLGFGWAGRRPSAFCFVHFVGIFADYAIVIIRASTVDDAIDNSFAFDCGILDYLRKVNRSLSYLSVLVAAAFLFALFEQHEETGLLLELGIAWI